MGGTVPVTTTFRDVLGVDTVFFSFSTADEDIHAPNEFYRPERFSLGLRAWPLLWSKLAASYLEPASFSAFKAFSYTGKFIFWLSGTFRSAISQFAIAFLRSPRAV